MSEFVKQLLIVCPLLFLAGLCDSIAGGGGTISLPALMLAGLPTHFALGTNKMCMSVGTAVGAGVSVAATTSMSTIGASVGAGVSVGAAVGSAVGSAVGPAVGSAAA